MKGRYAPLRRAALATLAALVALSPWLQDARGDPIAPSADVEGPIRYGDAPRAANRPPTAGVRLRNGSAPGEVIFDAASSSDSDGAIVSWRWDFGDGLQGFGSSLAHTYGDLKRSYEGSLTVTDNAGASATFYFTLSFNASGGGIAQANERCICKDITLRGVDLSDPAMRRALGPFGDGSRGWVQLPDKRDGATAANPLGATVLGPLDADPANRTIEGEKLWTGYTFELLAQVEGDPARCREIQLVKGTLVFPRVDKASCDRVEGDHNARGECTAYSRWRGLRADLDKDGSDDIDVADPDKCRRARGRWDTEARRCALAFPQAGAKYGPDTPVDTMPGGAYEAPSGNKQYANRRIVWIDTPSVRGLQAAGGMIERVTFKADFVSLIRGTDAKYCYVAFSADFERRAGKDKETLTQTSRGVGVDRVPGVP